MKSEMIRIGTEVDEQTALTFKAWGKEEGRSRKRHIAIVLRRIAVIRKERPEALKQIGLAS